MKIGKYMYYIEDTDNKIDFRSILKHKYDSLFKKYGQDVPNFGNVHLTTWNRFTIVNQSSREWHLLVDNYSLDTLNFFYADTPGNYNKIQSGRSLPRSQKQYKIGVYAFDIKLREGDSAVFYLQVHSYFMQYPLILMTREKFIETYHKKDRLEGFYYGFLLFIILYNLIFYFSTRDRSYLYHIFYVFFTGLMIAQLKGFIAELWGDRFHFMWQYAPAIIALSGPVSFLFTQHVLDTKKNAPFLHRIMNYVFMPVYAIIVLLSLFGENFYASILNQLVGMFALCIMYVTSIIVYRKGFSYAIFYLAACWAYFTGVVIYVLKAFTILPFTDFTDNAIEIGSTIQMIMFSFTLAAKVNAYKRERAIAQKELVQSLRINAELIEEQNKVLEVKVDERTSALKKTLHALEQSQEELKHKNKVITEEKERSDKLLLNILPLETARELKEKGYAKARMHEKVTVMFTDFKDFTKITEQMTPAELVAELNYFFCAFDAVIDRYNIEKIKTIGDSYMAAAGLQGEDNESAVKIVKAGLEMLSIMGEYNQQRISSNLKPFEIRIGVHSGPVVAGIVGTKKFAYDIWGDTVNIASRMESSGAEGKINISDATYNIIKNCFKCTYRGKIQAKGKGITDMYFAETFKD